MEIINKLIVIAIWITYAIYEGKREAYYYQLVAVMGVIRPNIHWIYLLQRGLFLVVIGLGLWSITIPIALAFIFPFFHDGFYYMKYNDLYPAAYPERFSFKYLLEKVSNKRFISESTTSTAVMEFNWVTRCVMFAIGVLSLTLNIIICAVFGL